MRASTLAGSLPTGVSVDGAFALAVSRFITRGNADGYLLGWARYMEWMYDVEVKWTSQKAFKAVGVAATL